MSHPEIIVALDVPDRSSFHTALNRLPPECTWVKIGLELFIAEGPAVLEIPKNMGKSVFLDLKLHDIPRTVERAVSSALRYGVDLLTVHACGGEAMLKAAAHARDQLNSPARIVAVTVLTSLDASDLEHIGILRTPAAQVTSMAQLSLTCGINGVVASVSEAALVARATRPGFLIVTPGIRPAGTDTADQKRVATPSAAVRAGSTHIVVGRPILDAPDPAAAFRAIREELLKP
ncbi:MAG TPA: orotidine-5'-phosphate decarboxylase [Kiritimatiellia bacterium]|nr:orotidine-5'-phosphate decarboxylase [Kiritimatiellia bacterium]